MSEEAGALAGLLHEKLCDSYPGRPRWDKSAAHRKYYQDRAQALIAKLEPEIGIANVFTVIPMVIEELM